MKKLVLAFSTFLLCCFLLACQQEETKPNILFIFTDDQTYKAVSALGNDEIETPNLDHLVNNGTTFTHAYNMGAWNGAVCLASRAMINSGRFVWRAHEQSRRWGGGDSIARTQAWGPLMEAAGYRTYMTGKWHVEAPADELFQTARHIRPGMPNDRFVHSAVAGLYKRHEGNPPLDSVLTLFPPGYNRPLGPDDDSWDPTDPQFGGFWEGGKHWSEVLADDGVEYIQDAAKHDEPFFMYLAFNAPHDPRQAPKEYVDKYEAGELSVPASFQPLYPKQELIGNGRALRDEALAPFPRTEFAVRTHKKEYYAIITHLDAQVGRILETLEATGKAENTVIMFTADHGLAMGHHGLLGKQNLYDHSVRVPLVLTGPDIPKGAKNATDVYLQDVMATALDLADVEKPEYVEFNSLLPLIKGANAAPYPAIYGGYVNWQRSIRKDGYKLLVYPQVPTLKLFDLKQDPEEINNLAQDPEQQERVAAL
ncbi:MAG: sulfatase-like hydrolase/transferase, partial [Bacteroidota bacterium]